MKLVHSDEPSDREPAGLPLDLRQTFGAELIRALPRQQLDEACRRAARARLHEALEHLDAGRINEAAIAAGVVEAFAVMHNWGKADRKEDRGFADNLRRSGMPSHVIANELADPVRHREGGA